MRKDESIQQQILADAKRRKNIAALHKVAAKVPVQREAEKPKGDYADYVEGFLDGE
jgi:hypothetical protein